MADMYSVAYIRNSSGGIDFTKRIVILTLGEVNEDKDSFRSYSTSTGGLTSALPASQINTGVINPRVGRGNRWVNHHFAFGVTTPSPYTVSSFSTSGDYQACSGVNVSYGGVQISGYSGWFPRGFSSSQNGQSTGLKDRTVYFSTLDYSDGGTASFNCSGVAVSADKYNSVLPNHIGGESCVYKAVPNENYRVKAWSVNGKTVSNSSNKNQITITLPSADADVYCEFEQYVFPVTVKSGASSTSIGTISKTITSTYYATGTSVGTFTATVKDTANYKFQGWYKGYFDNATVGNCTIPVTTEASVKITSESSAVTYCAKFASKKTTVTVKTDGIESVGTEKGEGTFSMTLKNGNTTVASKTNTTTYTNSNAREGWKIKLSATPKSEKDMFKYWEIPNGASGKTTNTNASLSEMTLVARDAGSSDFTAYFKKKLRNKKTTPYILGKGKLAWSSSIHGSGGPTNTTGGEYVGNWTLYEESTYTFEAVDTDALWKFERFEYRQGGVWKGELTNSSKPSWIQKVDNRVITAYVPEGDTDDTRAIRAVFLETPTFIVPNPTVEGSHSVSGILASAGGCTISGLPEPDKTDTDGNKCYAEGKKLTIRATVGAKWKFSYIEVVYEEDDTETFSTTSIELVVTKNIEAIRAVFVAKTYNVSLSVDKDSQGSGTVKLIYPISKTTNETLQSDTTISADVYIDTTATIEAISNDNTTISFNDWQLNGEQVNYPAKQNISIGSSKTFVARFNTKQTFLVEGSITENDKVYQLGKLDIEHEEFVTSIPDAKGNTSVSIPLVCGSFFSLNTFAQKGSTSTGTVYEGFFKHWEELVEENGKEVWKVVNDWGESVSSITVKTPRTLKAVFSNENRWPILRIVEQDENNPYATIVVNGVKEERQQTLNNGNLVTLVRKNDYFCEPFSTVEIALTQNNPDEKFLQWDRLQFGDIDNVGTATVEEKFATTKNISVFVSNNISLTPLFFNGNPISATAFFADGVSSDAGIVRVEGDFISSDIPSQAFFAQGSVAVFVASPRNGNRFVKWSSRADASDSVTTNPRYEVVINGPQVFYAVFEEEDDAIYRFGESEETKTMTWHSKRVTVNTPTSFSVAQVDAEGYKDNVTKLSVLKASSPDVPADGRTYTIKDGNSRRLAIDGRGEKNFEFVVESSVPVNRVAISTSATGLMGGA